ncbi:hypothetical protein VZT92_006962 [Zoarces viviparus]|uniref:Uncharacterized protein n=1 Tax=Zoarces viviparus TaxID=48416 RepID=A0AAW1FJG3_ZOAVI
MAFRIGASFLQVSAEVDAGAEHPVFRLAKTVRPDGLSIPAGGAVVHDVLSIINGRREAQWNYPIGQLKVVFSPLVLHVGVRISVGKMMIRLQKESKRKLNSSANGTEKVCSLAA